LESKISIIFWTEKQLRDLDKNLKLAQANAGSNKLVVKQNFQKRVLDLRYHQWNLIYPIEIIESGRKQFRI
jgi:hypothetical protein